MDFTINFYEARNGRRYVEEFLVDLKKDNPMLQKKTLAMIKKLGNKLYHKEPVSKSLNNGLFEGRSNAGRSWARVMYTIGENKDIFLLCGFLKKSNKLKSTEIDYARKLVKEFKERNKYI